MKFIDNLKAFLYKVMIEKADKWGGDFEWAKVFES